MATSTPSTTATTDKPIDTTVAVPNPATPTAPTPAPAAPTLTGTRAVLWSPAKDPTTFDLPRGATEMRPFVMAYLDESAIDITPLSPTGAVIPAFLTFVLQPGLNWVDESALSSAIDAAALAGESVQRVTPDIVGSIERLKIASRQGSDPIEVQTRANAIRILEPLDGALMTGTLSDYGISEISEICAVVNDATVVESWLSSIASNAVNPHPQKAAVERLLRKTLDDINSGNR